MACSAYFHDLCVLLYFLPVAIAGYWAIPKRRWKLAWLVGASLTFYGFWDVRFIPLLLGSALLDYLVGLRLGSTDRKKLWLTVSVVFNLGVLAIFKYAMWATDSAQSFLDIIGSTAELPGYNIVLPVGISFYTFQSMSYTIDVYRGRVPATHDLLKYTAFVTLFPQLVAGPIVRYKDLSQQLDDLPTRLSRTAAVTGLSLFAIGLFKKVVIADSLAPHVDELWSLSGYLGPSGAWMATLGYTLQLYFDFSGYSDMAIGLGALLGLTLPTNFRAPYQALNPSDFWRRWHISLSTWLKDYLYIPLGGNRGPVIRVLSNLMIVMALGGLWHGAAWTFVVWGVYHGIILVAYHATRRVWDAAPKLVQGAATFFLVAVGWVLFRAETVAQALTMYLAMFQPAQAAVAEPAALYVVAVLWLLAFCWLWKPSAEMRFEASWRRAAVTSGMVFLAMLMLRADSPFLYYQF